MYYVPYEQKMLKIARIRDQIYRFRYLILAIILAIVSSIVTLLAMKGNITQEVSIQPTYVYGETITPSSKAFLSNTSYEYFDKEWTEEKPVRPGFYQVRAKAKGGFGSYKYSKIQNFTIERRKLSFKLSESVTYGDMPEISFSGLLPGDTVDTSSCIFNFAEITSRQTSVSLKKSSLSISSDRYGDITECYHIGDSLFEGVAIELLGYGFDIDKMKKELVKFKYWKKLKSHYKIRRQDYAKS